MGCRNPYVGGAGCCTSQSQPFLARANPEFDMDVLTHSPGANCAQYGITGWVIGPNTYVQEMSTTNIRAHHPQGCASRPLAAVPGSILQTLGATVRANTTYVLSLGGARADYSFSGYVAYLLTGSVTHWPPVTKRRQWAALSRRG
jgi:hypothetical protein